MSRLQFAGAGQAVYSATCEQCGALPNEGARLCRRCKRKRFFKACAAVFIVCELAAAGAFLLIPQKKPAVLRDTQIDVPAVKVVDGVTGWLYYDTQDRVIGDVTHHARLLSNAPRNDANDTHLKGVAAGMLQLSSSKAYGRQIMVSFGKVKTACEANPCQVRVEFDETQPQVFPYTDVSDDHETVLMLGDYDRFAQRLAVAHDLTFVASLGTAHDSVLSFTVAGYRMAANGRGLVIELAASKAKQGSASF
jgi:hypothetical protein